MRYFPINLDVAGRRVLVVGGGRVACRKVQSLLHCGAEVTVVSPEFCADFADMPGLRRVQRGYQRDDLDGVCLAISATDCEAVNGRVWEDARAARIPVNVVDQPARCTFTVPSVVARGDLMLTISTGGASPALAAKLRRRLETWVDDAFVAHVALLGELRPRVKASGLSVDARGRLMKRMAGDEIEELIRTRGTAAARRRLNAWLRRAAAPPE